MLSLFVFQQMALSDFVPWNADYMFPGFPCIIEQQHLILPEYVIPSKCLLVSNPFDEYILNQDLLDKTKLVSASGSIRSVSSATTPPKPTVTFAAAVTPSTSSNSTITSVPSAPATATDATPAAQVATAATDATAAAVVTDATAAAVATDASSASA